MTALAVVPGGDYGSPWDPNGANARDLQDSPDTAPLLRIHANLDIDDRTGAVTAALVQKPSALPDGR